MELCGLLSSSNGHTHVQEWHSEASAGYLPPKRKRSDFPNMNGDKSDCASAFPVKETSKNHSKCSSIMHNTIKHRLSISTDNTTGLEKPGAHHHQKYIEYISIHFILLYFCLFHLFFFLIMYHVASLP